MNRELCDLHNRRCTWAAIEATVISFHTADWAESKEHELVLDISTCVTVRRWALFLWKEFQQTGPSPSKCSFMLLAVQIFTHRLIVLCDQSVTLALAIDVFKQREAPCRLVIAAVFSWHILPHAFPLHFFSLWYHTAQVWLCVQFDSWSWQLRCYVVIFWKYMQHPSSG